MSALTPEIIEALKAKHGSELRKVGKDPFEVVVRPPNKAEWRRYVDRSAKEPASALEQLGLACIAWPDGAELAALLDAKPGVTVRTGAMAEALAGVDRTEEVEKLLSSCEAPIATMPSPPTRCLRSVTVTTRSRRTRAHGYARSLCRSCVIF